MKLTVLGCGDAFASEGRFNTSFLVETESHRFLLDCGASTLIRLKQLKVDVTTIDTIVITHFHGDHFGGIPFFVLSNFVEYQRSTPFTIIGPEGVREKVYTLQDALYPGTSEILDKLNVQFLEYHDSQHLTYEALDIYARKVSHAPPSHPHGLRITVEGKRLAFSGDTEWNDSLLDLARDTDLFIVEANNYLTDSPGHLSYRNILERKEDFKSRRIVLTHMGSEILAQPALDLERLSDGQVIAL